MYFHNALETLEKNPKFKEWKKKNNNCKLSYGFLAIDQNMPMDWQLGFYDNKKDMITTFAMLNGELAGIKEDKVLKKEGVKVLPIDTKKIKLNVEQILELVDSIQKKEYGGEVILKTIVIIQKLPKLGDVWNITLVTQSFKTINLKLDASTGKVKEQSSASLIQNKAS